MNWIRQLLSRRQLDRDLAEEVRGHLEERVEQLVERGLSPHEAARQARREFGNVASIAESARAVWRWEWIEDFLFDVRFGFRQLRRAPGFAVAGAFTLALGIGANTAVFSVVNAVVFRPLPFARSNELVSLTPRNNERVGTALSYPTFFDLRKESTVFTELVSYRSADFTLTRADGSVQIRGGVVARNLLTMLGVAPFVGRDFVADDEEPGARVVIISHPLWVSLGSNPNIVGQTITLDDEAHEVVGVTPEGFNFPVGGAQVHLWTPLSRDARAGGADPVTRQRGARMLNVIGRLRPGVSVPQAQAQIAAVAASLVARFPTETKRWPGIYLQPLLRELAGPFRGALLFLLGAAGLVLLLTCANIANLLLSRTAEREREFALRTAIGAGRSRIVRQIVAESAALALVAGLAGVGAALLLLRVGIPVLGANIPRLSEARLDRSALMVSIVTTAATCLLFSLAPMAQLTRRNVHDRIREGGRSQVHGGNRLRDGLVVVQIVLGLVLVSAAGLLTASYVHLVRRDPGFNARPLLVFDVPLPSARYPAPRQIEFYDALIDRLDHLPGVTDAAGAMPLPLTGSSMTMGFEVGGRPIVAGARPSANMAIVTHGFFEATGITLLSGRQFTSRDDAGHVPVVIVNRAFADAFFPGENAIGKYIKPGAIFGSQPPPMREIVGVVGNARQSPLGRAAEPIYYVPYRQLPWCCPSLVVRSASEPRDLTTPIASVVASLDKELAVRNVRSAESILGSGIALPRLLMLLMGSFAVMGLLLSGVGLYGVMSYGVVKRTREIGVRIALGASRRSVLAMVTRQAAPLVGIGLAVGTAGAVVVGRIMRSFVFGVESWQPLLLAGAIVVVVTAATLATVLPARRAASVDPALTLRTE